MNNWIELLHTFKKERKKVALVTVTNIQGSAPCKLGAKMIVTLEKEFYGTIGGGKLEFKVIQEAIEVIKTNSIKQFSYTLGPEFEQCCGGRVELIIESMNQTPQLYIFGAGHIGVELANIMVNTPFETILLDTRENWREECVLDKNITFTGIDFDLYKSYVTWGPNCFVVILTHDHKLDFEITALAIENPTRYIGLIGSKTKRNKFNNKLIHELHFENGITPVHCPVGLDLGGNSPKEIAISIAAELLKEYYEK